VGDGRLKVGKIERKEELSIVSTEVMVEREG